MQTNLALEFYGILTKTKIIFWVTKEKKKSQTTNLTKTDSLHEKKTKKKKKKIKKYYKKKNKTKNTKKKKKKKKTLRNTIKGKVILGPVYHS